MPLSEPKYHEILLRLADAHVEAIELDGRSLRVIGLAELLQIKKRAGRPKDRYPVHRGDARRSCRASLSVPSNHQSKPNGHWHHLRRRPEPNEAALSRRGAGCRGQRAPALPPRTTGAPRVPFALLATAKTLEIFGAPGQKNLELSSQPWPEPN